MKRKVKRTTPARAEVTKTVEVTVCDLCGSERPVVACLVCGRDACSWCVVNNYTAGSDSPDKSCSLCHYLRNKYKPQINATVSVQEAAEDAIRAAWKAESLGEKGKP